MRKITSDTIFNANLAAAWVFVVAVAPPQKGSALYRVQMRLTNLDPANGLSLRESQAGGGQFDYDLLGSGETGRTVISEFYLDETEGAMSIYLKDTVSTSATIEYDVYAVQETNPQYEPLDPTPIPPGSATGMWANEGDLDDLRGIDNITSWSDLENAKSRNSTRIQRAFDYAEAEIRSRLSRRYDLPLSGLSTDDQLKLRYWSAVMAAHHLYIHRGQRDAQNLPPSQKATTVFDAERKAVQDDIWAHANGIQSFSAPQQSMRPIGLGRGDFRTIDMRVPSVWVF